MLYDMAIIADVRKECNMKVEGAGRYVYICHNTECGNYRETQYANHCGAFNSQYKYKGKCQGFITKDQDAMQNKIERASYHGHDKRDDLIKVYEMAYGDPKVCRRKYGVHVLQKGSSWMKYGGVNRRNLMTDVVFSWI